MSHRPNALPARLNLSQQRKRAKDLLKALRAGSAEALERVARHVAHGACVAGDAARVRAMLEAEPELARRWRTSDHQMTSWAARRGKVLALERLLEAGLDPNVPDDDGQTPLHFAIGRGDVKAVEVLARYQASARARDYEGLTAVDCVLLHNDDERRRAMLACLASSDGGDEVRRLLGSDDELRLPDDADVEDVPDVLRSARERLDAAFDEAVRRMAAGDLDGLRELIDREPSLVTARSPRYHRATLLHYLSSNGIEAVVVPKNAGAIAELLLERGAVVDASCRMYGGGPDQTTLGLVVTSDHAEREGLMHDLVGALVRAGAKIHGHDHRSSALEGAIMYAHADAVRALVDNGACAYSLPVAAAIGDLAYVERDLQRSESAREIVVEALQNAAAFGHLGILERLLKTGVDVDALGSLGAAATHRAAAANRVAVVERLLEHGANPTLADRVHHGTPAGWARQFGAREAARLLEAAAAQRKRRHDEE